MSNEIQCPKCGSIQLTANKKGYSLTKGIAGMVITGGVGLLGGLFGSGKIIITCLSCGKQFKPGEGLVSKDVIITDTEIEIHLLPELETDENAKNDSDISDIILEDYKKDALLSEFDGDLVKAASSWKMYLYEMIQNKKECDLKSIDMAINCYQHTGNVISEFFLYEDLISNYPNHPNINLWEISMEKLKPMMSSK